MIPSNTNLFRYEWPEGKQCAVIFSFDVDGESPYLFSNASEQSAGIGELEQRKFGPRVGVYRILDLLERCEMPGSFYVPAYTAETYPELLPSIVANGHEVAMHGYLHERVDRLTFAENHAVMVKSFEIFGQQLAKQTFGYRSPAWEMTPELFDLLKEFELQYDSSLMGFDHPYEVNGIVELPVQWLLDDAIFFRYTAGPRDKGAPTNPDQVLANWIQEFDGIRKYGGLFMLTMHPWLTGRAQRIALLERLIRHIQQFDDVWCTTAEAVADYHKASSNSGSHVVNLG